MSAPVTIDWLRACEVTELQRLLEEHWRPGHVLARDTELLRWQHRLPEDPGRLSVLVAREGESIVGALGAIVVSFGVRGRRVPGAWLSLWLVTPAARERQVGLRLLRHVLAEPYGFVGTIGANEAALGIYSALGFAVRPSIPRWVRVLSEDALARLTQTRPSAGGAPPSWPAAGSTPRSWPAAGGAPPSQPTAGGAPPPQPTAGGAPPPQPTAGGAPPPQPTAGDALPASPASEPLSVAAWSGGHAEPWDDAWTQRLAPRLVGTWRDAAYLRWRYLEHPRFAYALRVAHDSSGALHGLAVHRIVSLGARGTVIRLVELLGNADAVRALTCDVLAVGTRHDAAFVELYCTHGAVAQPLRACGFTFEPDPSERLPALFEPLNFSGATLTGALRASAELGGSALFETDELYVTRSDCDQDRPH